MTIFLQISPMRMGSTWQFNLICELLRVAEVNFTSCYWEGKSDLAEFFREPIDNIVIKSHFFDPDLLHALSSVSEVKVLCSLRNLHDSVCSYLRVMPNKNQQMAEKEIEQSLDVINKLIELDLDFFFTQMDDLHNIETIMVEVRCISDFLELKIGVKDLEQIARSLTKENVRARIEILIDESKNFDKIDKASHWHGNHVGSELEQFGYSSIKVNLKSKHLEEKYRRVMTFALAHDPANSFEKKQQDLLSDHLEQHVEKVKERNETIISRIRQFYVQTDSLEG